MFSGLYPCCRAMPSCSSWVDIGGYTAWSLPSTACPSSRASAATPPMKVPAMPRIWIFKNSSPLTVASSLSKRLLHGTDSPSPACGRGQGVRASRDGVSRHPGLGVTPSHGSDGAGALTDFTDRRDRFQDAGEHLVQRADAIDHGQLAVLAVELDHRRGLAAVDVQPLAHRFGVVVGATFGGGAAGDAFDQQVGRDFQ